MRISDWSSDVCSSDLCTLFKYQDVLSVLRDPKTFTSTLLNEGLGQFLGGFLLTGMEDSKHKLTRNLLAPAFSPKALLEWKALVAPVARDAITTLAERKRADLIADLLRSEESRVGKECVRKCRSRWSQYILKKK